MSLALAQAGAALVHDFGPDVDVSLHADGPPVVVRATSPTLRSDPVAAADWFVARRRAIDAVLPDWGAIMFQRFALPTTTDFENAVRDYASPPHGYSGGATPRSNIQGRVFEATAAPADLTLQMHQEMAYLPHWPRKLAFYCRVAPETGGETLIADVRQFEKTMNPVFRDSVAERGVMYRRNFRNDAHDATFPDWLKPAHRSWREAFYTDDPQVAEDSLRAMGVDFVWEDDGSLTSIFCAPGFVDHPETGERRWFNQIPSQTVTPIYMSRYAEYEAHYGDHRPRPYDPRYGDGGRIPVELVIESYRASDACTVAFPWENGAVLMIDNVNTFHGRSPYAGKRDVQVALLEEGAQ